MEGTPLSFQRLLVSPREIKGMVVSGSFGGWVVPNPPEEAPYEQIMDHAAVIALAGTLTPLRSEGIGFSQQIDQAARAYLDRWHGDANKYFKLFTPGE